MLGDFNMTPAKKKHTPTLTELIDGWKHGGEVDPGWMYAAELKLKRSTISSYKKNLKNHVKPHLGKRPINSITPKDVSDLIIKILKNGKRSQTVKNIKNCLSSIFEKAKTDGHVQVNPCRGVLVPVPEDERPKREPDHSPGKIGKNSKMPSNASSRFFTPWWSAGSGLACGSGSWLASSGATSTWRTVSYWFSTTSQRAGSQPPRASQAAGMFG